LARAGGLVSYNRDSELRFPQLFLSFLVQLHD